jgi:Transglycosylase SLT domain.
MMTPALFYCILAVAQMHSVPPAVIYAIREVEGGKVGAVTYNRNGSYDIGPMQINNQAWLGELAARWSVSKAKAEAMIKYDECTNVEAATWILAQRIRETGNLWLGVAAYHNYKPKYGGPYLQKVVARIERNIALQRRQMMQQTGRRQ